MSPVKFLPEMFDARRILAINQFEKRFGQRFANAQIDGFQVAARLRQLEDPPAVILTSSRDRADYGRCIGDCGARGFVPKADLSGAAIAALFAA